MKDGKRKGRREGISTALILYVLWLHTFFPLRSIWLIERYCVIHWQTWEKMYTWKPVKCVLKFKLVLIFYFKPAPVASYLHGRDSQGLQSFTKVSFKSVSGITCITEMSYRYMHVYTSRMCRMYLKPLCLEYNLNKTRDFFGIFLWGNKLPRTPSV